MIVGCGEEVGGHEDDAEDPSGNLDHAHEGELGLGVVVDEKHDDAADGAGGPHDATGAGEPEGETAEEYREEVDREEFDSSIAFFDGAAEAIEAEHVEKNVEGIGR